MPGLPSQAINGTRPSSIQGGDTNPNALAGRYKQQYDIFAAQPSDVTIAINNKQNGNTVEITATVNVLDNITTLQKNIIFILTYNFRNQIINGRGDYNYTVVRYQQRAFNFSTPTENEVFTQSFTLDPNWLYEEINTIVLIQPLISGSSSIIQAAIKPLIFETDEPKMLNYNLFLNQSVPEIQLEWGAPEYYVNAFLFGYNIYRNGELYGQSNEEYFADLDFELDKRYTYWVTAIFDVAESFPSNIIEVLTGDVSEYTNPDISSLTRLGNNFPNPFNPSTTIEFNLPKNSNVTLEIFNIRGQLIQVLVNQNMNEGLHTVEWDGKNTKGQSVSSGTYFYRLNTEDYTETKRMMLLK